MQVAQKAWADERAADEAGAKKYFCLTHYEMDPPALSLETA